MITPLALFMIASRPIESGAQLLAAPLRPGRRLAPAAGAVQLIKSAPLIDLSARNRRLAGWLAERRRRARRARPLWRVGRQAD